MNYIEKTIVYVKEELTGAEAGHDWFHIERVYNNTLNLLKTEKVNEQVAVLGALLHDIADSKFHNGDETIGPKKALEFMTSIGIEEDVKMHVVNIIENISFKGGNFEKKFHSKELDVVQDADRLDAIGAIGIARAFTYGGFKNRILYDATQQPVFNMTKEQYKNHEGTTINHFYEKLLLLKDLMNTNTGKEIAQKRHEFMQQYLNVFLDEMKGY